MKKVGFWLRLVSAIIDAGLLLIALALLNVVISTRLTRRISGIVALSIVILYTTTEIFWARSPGKMLMHQRIARFDSLPADRWRLLSRWFGKQSPLIMALLFVSTDWPLFHLLYGFSGAVVVVGCLYASSDDHRAWHDNWAGTGVYERSQDESDR